MVTTAATGGVASSAIEERARKLWPADAQAPQLAGIRAQWQADWPDQPPLCTWDDLCVALAEPEGPLMLMASLRDAAHTVGRGTAPWRTDACQLILALLLLSFQRHVQCQAVKPGDADAWTARLAQISQPLEAQLLAACATGAGLLALPSTDGGEPEAQAANIIHGLPPEVMHQRSAQEALRMEVDIAAKTLRLGDDEPGGLVRRQQRARSQVQAPRSEAAVRLEVSRFRQHHQAGLFVLAPAASATPALCDPALHVYGRDKLGVPIQLYGPLPGSPAPDADASWQELAADIAQPWREAIAALYPRSSAQAMADAAQPPQVFLSYAHADDDQMLVRRVRDTLEALQQNGHIRLWIDTKGIRTGQQFDPDIQAGIDGSRIALVLVSGPLLQSAYVMQHELPYILKRRDALTLTFCPFLLRDCHFVQTPNLEAVNFKLGVQPLEAMDDAGKSSHLKNLSQWICDHLAGKAN